MKKITVLILLILVSCQYFEKQVPNEEELLQLELKKINWKQIDEFPSIASCDTLDGAEERKQCFFDYLRQTIQQRLDKDTLNMLYPEIDTINVMVTVFPDATVTFEPQFPADSISQNKLKIDSILNNKLSGFPKIHPALKRGIPVKTQFLLPVILNIETE